MWSLLYYWHSRFLRFAATVSLKFQSGSQDCRGCTGSGVNATLLRREVARYYCDDNREPMLEASVPCVKSPRCIRVRSNGNPISTSDNLSRITASKIEEDNWMQLQSEEVGFIYASYPSFFSYICHINNNCVLKYICVYKRNMNTYFLGRTFCLFVKLIKYWLSTPKKCEL